MVNGAASHYCDQEDCSCPGQSGRASGKAADERIKQIYLRLVDKLIGRAIPPRLKLGPLNSVNIEHASSPPRSLLHHRRPPATFDICKVVHRL